MNDNIAQAAVRKFLRDEFRREQESDFALLRRIPSTDVRMFLDYFFGLSKSDQDALAEGLVQHALVSFFSSMPNAFEAGNAAFKQYLDAKCQMSGWKYTSVPAMRSMLAVAKQDPNSQTANYLTKKMREQIDAIKLVKSTEIRKVVKLALSQVVGSFGISSANGGVCAIFRHGDEFYSFAGIKSQVIARTPSRWLVDYPRKDYIQFGVSPFVNGY